MSLIDYMQWYFLYAMHFVCHDCRLVMNRCCKNMQIISSICVCACVFSCCTFILIINTHNVCYNILSNNAQTNQKTRNVECAWIYAYWLFSFASEYSRSKSHSSVRVQPNPFRKHNYEFMYIWNVHKISYFLICSVVCLVCASWFCFELAKQTARNAFDIAFVIYSHLFAVKYTSFELCCCFSVS